MSLSYTAVSCNCEKIYEAIILWILVFVFTSTNSSNLHMLFGVSNHMFIKHSDSLKQFLISAMRTFIYSAHVLCCVLLMPRV